MKNSLFFILCVFVVLLIAFPATMLIILFLAFFIYLVVKSIRKEKNYATVSPYDDNQLPCPGSEYSFYTIVGMKYRNLSQNDLGIHRCAVAIAENNNPHDRYAVGIYKSIGGSLKLVGYVPRNDNQELHEFINQKCNGRTPATYRIWKRFGEYYGVAYIKDKEREKQPPKPQKKTMSLEIKQ